MQDTQYNNELENNMTRNSLEQAGTTCQEIHQEMRNPNVTYLQRHRRPTRTTKYNKKLCCREEHSASVVLSWCTL